MGAPKTVARQPGHWGWWVVSGARGVLEVGGGLGPRKLNSPHVKSIIGFTPLDYKLKQKKKTKKNKKKNKKKNEEGH